MGVFEIKQYNSYFFIQITNLHLITTVFTGTVCVDDNGKCQYWMLLRNGLECELNINVSKKYINSENCSPFHYFIRIFFLKSGREKTITTCKMLIKRHSIQFVVGSCHFLTIRRLSSWLEFAISSAYKYCWYYSFKVRHASGMYFEISCPAISWMIKLFCMERVTIATPCVLITLRSIMVSFEKPIEQ